MTSTFLSNTSSLPGTPAAFRAEPRGGLAIQAKLAIGQPNDKYEREADTVADQVVSMKPEQTIQRACACGSGGKQEAIQEKPLANTIARMVQRMGGGMEEEMQMKRIQRMGGPEEEMQMKRIQRMGGPEEEMQMSGGDGGGTASSWIENQINSSRGGGAPLSGETSNYMGSRFGSDFSNVRVHTDSTAVQMNQELNSQAFTVGSDIYFNQGKYSPGSDSGNKLLAHELTHTVQQGAVE